MTAPYTGLERADWLVTADRLLTALRPWASADHATITPPGEPGGYGRPRTPRRPPGVDGGRGAAPGRAR